MTITYDFAGTGALSADWSKRIGGSNAVTRQSDVGKLNAAWDGSQYIYIYTTTGSPNDGYSQIAVVGGAANTNNRIGAAYRFTTSGNADGYSCEFRLNAADGNIYRWTNGSLTSIAWIGSGGAGTSSTIKIAASGTTITAHVDGVQKLSVTDSNYASGNAGFHYYSNRAATDQVQIDNFEASQAGGGTTYNESVSLSMACSSNVPASTLTAQEAIGFAYSLADAISGGLLYSFTVSNNLLVGDARAITKLMSEAVTIGQQIGITSGNVANMVGQVLFSVQKAMDSTVVGKYNITVTLDALLSVVLLMSYTPGDGWRKMMEAVASWKGTSPVSQTWVKIEGTSGDWKKSN